MGHPVSDGEGRGPRGEEGMARGRWAWQKGSRSAEGPVPGCGQCCVTPWWSESCVLWWCIATGIVPGQESSIAGLNGSRLELRL